MSKEERYINNKIGNHTPFRVPEGYFDKFATDFMENLPEREPVTILARKKTRFIKMWRVAAAAACITAAMISTAVLMDNESAADTQHVAESITSTATTTDQLNHDDYVDVVADYAMMDNSDIIACLSEE